MRMNSAVAQNVTVAPEQVSQRDLLQKRANLESELVDIDSLLYRAIHLRFGSTGPAYAQLEKIREEIATLREYSNTV